MSPNTPFWGQVKFALFGLAGLALGVVAIVFAVVAAPFVWVIETLMEDDQ